MRSIKLFIIIIVMFYSAAVFAGDWPQYLGPDRNGISPDKGINKNWEAKPPKVLWTTDIHDLGYAGPCVAAGMVFIIDRDKEEIETGVVRALDFKTGKDIWSFSFDDPGDPGNKNWGYGRSTPAYDNGKLYVTSRNNHVFCFDAATGKKLWSVDLIKKYRGKIPRWHIAVSPIIDGNNLIVCPGG